MPLKFIVQLRPRRAHKLGREDRDALARGTAWSFIGTMTAGPSGARCQVSHMPRRLPAVLRVADPSSFALKIILTP